MTEHNPDEWQYVNRLQLAALLGVHADTVSDYTRAGMPVLSRGRGKRESVYEAVACLAWHRAQHGQDAKEAAQTRAYDAQARLNELKLARQRGELVPREEVIRDGQAYTKAWAAQVRLIPRRLIIADVLPLEHETRARSLCDDILREIASWKTMTDLEQATESDAA